MNLKPLLNNAIAIGCNHLCKEHGVGPLSGGSPDVYFEGQNAGRVTDQLICPSGPPDKVKDGSPSVFANLKALTRVIADTDIGKMVEGLKSIFIGSTKGGLDSLLKAALEGKPFVKLFSTKGLAELGKAAASGAIQAGIERAAQGAANALTRKR